MQKLGNSSKLGLGEITYNIVQTGTGGNICIQNRLAGCCWGLGQGGDIHNKSPCWAWNGKSGLGKTPDENWVPPGNNIIENKHFAGKSANSGQHSRGHFSPFGTGKRLGVGDWGEVSVRRTPAAIGCPRVYTPLLKNLEDPSSSGL